MSQVKAQTHSAFFIWRRWAKACTAQIRLKRAARQDHLLPRPIGSYIADMNAQEIAAGNFYGTNMISDRQPRVEDGSRKSATAPYRNRTGTGQRALRTA